MTNSITDFEKADLLFVIGSNTTECHPIIGRIIRQGIKFHGKKLIVADARAIELSKIADIHLRHRPGSDVALINAMMHVIIKEGLHDEKFIAERTEDFEEMKENLLKNYAPEKVVEIVGITASEIVEAARLFANAKSACLLYGMGITQHTTGTDNVMSCANLLMLTGNIGREGAGLSPLRGQNNVQGACDMGALPNVLPGYLAVTENKNREKAETIWNADNLPKEIGLTMGDMMNRAIEGDLKAMYIMGENPVMSDPDMKHTRESLANLEFLVVQDIFPTETSTYADVILPAAVFAEKDGTFTNTERRVQKLAKAIDPPGEAKADWEIICLIAQRMGHDFDYKNTSDIMDEIAAITPIYGGIRYDRLDDYGLQWPCTDIEHPGTPILHRDNFTRGKGKFHAVEYKPPAESSSKDYPLILTTGRILEHFHTGSMSRRSDRLDKLHPNGAVDINPEDAAKLGIIEGDTITITSGRGKIETKVNITDKTLPGLAFMAFHWRESPANILTNPAFDPVSKIPEFKVSAVKAVLSVLDRAVQDNAFFALLSENPSQALKEYDLSNEEKAAIMSGDINKIESWVGKLDKRLEKWLIARLQRESW